MAPASLCVAFIGHKSSGKSSALGHMLVQRGTVEQRTLDKLCEDAQAIGRGAHKYAWICDKLAEERNEGHSIETSFSRFGSVDYDVTAIDTPGAPNLLKNAISGCAQADAAVLVVSAADSDVEAGLHISDNTRQHILMAQTFGIKKIVVAVNKMDVTSPPWSQERFEDVKTKVIIVYLLGLRTIPRFTFVRTRSFQNSCSHFIGFCAPEGLRSEPQKCSFCACVGMARGKPH